MTGFCRISYRAAGVEFVRGQTHSTSLRFAQGDKFGSEGISRDAVKGLFG